MHSLWSDADAERMVECYAGEGVARDLALRVYTSRLLGCDPRLVLHGGGNTSVKTVMKDLLDEEDEVLCVKGSGWDMAAIEPAGLPAVRLGPLHKLRGRAAGAKLRRGYSGIATWHDTFSNSLKDRGFFKGGTDYCTVLSATQTADSCGREVRSSDWRLHHL
jgi:hypothetical protein